ncbi:MAG TPA: hypothetical protein VHC20_04530, partial [Candidatus Paceibacterota bacterium]|nr:hypothetical protein [Candidatus Paceibacterota bacterium]
TASTGTANIAAARALVISGSTGENTFRDCVFGVDTISRGAANYTLEISGGSPRNYFQRCHFEAMAGTATAAHLLIGAAGIDRYVVFDGCIFDNAVKSTATTMNQVANLNAAIGGLIIAKDTVWLGATHWETSTTNQTFFNAPTYETSDPALLVNNA